MLVLWGVCLMMKLSVAWATVSCVELVLCWFSHNHSCCRSRPQAVNCRIAVELRIIWFYGATWMANRFGPKGFKASAGFGKKLYGLIGRQQLKLTDCKAIELKHHERTCISFRPGWFSFVSHNAKCATASAEGRTSHPASDSPWTGSWLCPGQVAMSSVRLGSFYYNIFINGLVTGPTKGCWPSFSSAALISLQSNNLISAHVLYGSPDMKANPCVSRQLCCLFSWFLGLPQDTLLITSRCLLSLRNERVQHYTQKSKQPLRKSNA